MVRSNFFGALLGVVALTAAGPVSADVKAGVDAWSRGDYPAAIREWKAPAEKGDSDAQFNLGQAYKLGRGVPQDLKKAEELFGKAAAQGHMQASDNYGLLLFQRGERGRAMPYIAAASDRGDARAQYLLGLAYFNGENVAKDWVRAYALVSLAQSAGLQQAVPALAQMDQHIPMEQRQQSVKLASELAAAADATRARQLAALDLGAVVPSAGSPVPSSMGTPSFSAGSPVPKIPATQRPSAAAAGADYTRPKPPGPRVPAIAAMLEEQPAKPAPGNPAPVKPANSKPVPAKPAPATSDTSTKPPVAKPETAGSGGSWRIQLGAFGVAGNADALWNRVKNRPELAGHAKLLVPVGKLSKLQAGGFASEAEAKAACSRLSAGGFACIPVRN